MTLEYNTFVLVEKILQYHLVAYATLSIWPL